MFSIGEFSKITGLTVKTLRFYHEQGVLVPTHVDEQSGYRYYSESKVEAARVIARLRDLDFPLADIAEILGHYDDEGDILEYIERQRRTVQDRLKSLRSVSDSLGQIIRKETEARAALRDATFDIEEKQLESMLIAGVRMKGRYADCGPGFAQVGKSFGWHSCGKPMMLHFDQEFKDEEADYEVCMPIRKGTSTDEVEVRELTGGSSVTLLHQGPYEELGRSYARIMGYVHERGYRMESPTREVYIKGPGMIFRGNPNNYLTEIQVLIES